MRLSLTKKYILSFLIFGISCFLMISTVTSQLIMKQVILEKASVFYQEGIYMSDQYVGNYFEQQDSQQKFSTVRSQLEALCIYLNARIWLISTDGMIILDSSESTSRNMHEEITGFDPVLPGGSYYTTGDFFGTLSEESLSVLIPVSHNYHVRGYIAIHVPLSVLTHEKESYLLPYYITLIALAVLGLLFVAANWLIVYYPLRRLRKAAGDYAIGNFQTPISLERDDELGYLAHTMDFMAGALRDYDEDQRKLISNVSHDFRSPLTSIKGYIEAILDGTIPPEMQGKYLNIVLRETERLTGLTHNLLVLNSMNPKQNRLNKTEFDINAVIKNTAAAFEGTCMAKTSKSIFCFPTGIPWFLRTCPRSSRYSIISLIMPLSLVITTPPLPLRQPLAMKRFLSPSGTPVSGIPRDSIKKIWERFYKTDLSRGKDKKGTGLGLAIVKEIIQLHGENINVVSTEGVGTEFIFSLSKAEKEDGES